MRDLKPFKINLRVLADQVVTYELKLDDVYFEAIEVPDVQEGSLSVALFTHRITGSFELSFHIQGLVIVACDLCLGKMQQPIDTENKLMAEFGEEYSDDNDLIVVPERGGVLDISWFIHELIGLSVLIKHVHAPGKCNAETTRKLQESSATRGSLEDGEEAINPHWAGLEKLKIIIRDQKKMAHPKRRQSKTCTLKRRTHDKIVVPTLTVCPDCGAYYVCHTVCPTRGYYRSKVVIGKEVAERWKKSTRLLPALGDIFLTMSPTMGSPRE